MSELQQLKDWAWRLERALHCGHHCDVSIAADAVMQSIKAEISRAPVQASEARGDWVLVPREPTDAMLAATGPVVFASAGQRWLGDGSISEQWVMDVQRDCYTAMISAHTQAGPVG